MSAPDPFHHIKRIAVEIVCIVSLFGTCGTMIYIVISKVPYPVQIALIVALILVGVVGLAVILIKVLGKSD